MNLSELVESTRQFLETTPAPVAGDDQVVEAPPVAGDDQVVEAPPVARHELPLTHSLYLVPRPFSQLARRSMRLGITVERGYTAGLWATPYYHQRRRRALLARAIRRRERPPLHIVTRLPPMLYAACEVA